MPELPEVELVARSLDKLLRGRTLRSARLLRAGLAPEVTPVQFSRLLRNSFVEEVNRRGKHILIHLRRAGRRSQLEPMVLITHLRMTGRFLLLPRAEELPRHAHALFRLDDERVLVFADQRHFGMMKIVPRAALTETKELRSLAPEPFSAEFTPDYLYGALQTSRRTLKETLLDQKKVTGLGNIYAAEAMFIARSNPFTRASQFSRRRVARLHKAILEVLGEAIRHGSTINVDPEDIDGSYYGGGYRGRWLVYDREGEPCNVCRASVRRTTDGGRSTYFCPRCQRR